MTTAINIEEAITDKESEFNIKRFRLGSIKVEKPIKILNVGNIRFKTYFEQQRAIEKYIPLYEVSRTFREETINKILDEDDNRRITKLFGYKEWATPLVLVYTLSFNPLKPRLLNGIRDLSGFMNYYYAYSSIALLVPNIKVKISVQIGRNPKTGRKKYKQITIISLEEYLQYVDWSVENLSSRNNKSIFVPLSLKFGIREIKDLAKHYLKKEYFNVWIDFESGSPTPQNIGKIRQFLEVFREGGRLEDIVIYSTNFSREFISNPQLDKTPSTDPITTLTGANIVGGNRGKGVPSDNESIPRPKFGELLEYKARLFDPTTYYYLHPNLVKDGTLQSLLLKKEYNTLINTLRISVELSRQADYFLKNHEIKHYVEQKQMLQEYREGDLLRELFRFSPRPKKRKLKSTPSKVTILDFINP